MADNLTQNGLSTGNFQAGSVNGGFQSIIANGSRPADIIHSQMKQAQSVGFLQYPTDLPKYYMGFQIMKYSRDSLLAVGITTPLNQIALPFPDHMVDSDSVAYDKKAFSATVGSALNTGFGAVNDLSNQVKNGASFGDVASSALKIGGQADQVAGSALQGLAVDAVGALTGEQGQAALGAAGYSPNYFLTVVLNGPQYKQYNLTWTMAPRTPKESVDLRQIIRVFSDAKAPGLALGGALFSFPRVFQNYYAPNRGLLYQFKPSVLMNFTVDYTGGGMPSMKQASDATGGWNAPSALKISATFMELEFWLRSDFGFVTPSDVGIQPFSDQKPTLPGTGRYQP